MIYLAEHLPEVKECLFCIFGGYVVYILQRHKGRGILTYYVAQHLCRILRLNIVGISRFQPKFFVLLAYGSFPCHADIYPVAYAALHIENEVGIILLLNIFIKPLDVWLAGCHILVVAGNKLRLFLRVKLRDDHVTILLESQVNVLGIDIPPRAIYHMTFSLVLAGAVHAADGLYGIDVFYLLVEEERVQLRLVKACLQFVHHDDKSVLDILEVINSLSFRNITIYRRTRLVLLTIAIYHHDGSIGVLGIPWLCTFLGIQFADNSRILYGNRNGRNCQHSLALTAYLAIHQRDETVYHKRGYLTHSWLKLIHFLLLLPHIRNVVLIAEINVLGHIKANGHIVGYDVLCGVEYVAIGYGFFHGVSIERHPQGHSGGTAELTKAAQRLVTWRGCETDEQIFLVYLLSTVVERVLQPFKEIDHLPVVLARVRAVYLIDEERHTHVFQLLASFIDSHLQVEKLLYVHHDDAPLVVKGIHKSLPVNSLHKHRLVNVHIVHALVQLVAQLQTVHYQHYLVVGVCVLVAVVLELQGCPAYDVALAEAGGILHEQRVDKLVVAEPLALGYYLLGLLLWYAEGIKFSPQLVGVIVGVALVVEHFLDAVHYLVAPELLFGAWRDEAAAV